MTKQHGIALPLSAIRTEQSSGIGEYLDLIPLIDWCADVGFNLIQLLPLNDTGTLASPYSARGALALHPIYLRLDEPIRFRATARVKYHKVLRKKRSALRQMVERFEPTPEFHDWVERSYWLPNYSRFVGEDVSVLQYLCHQQLMQVREHADRRGVRLMGDIPILLSPESADVICHPELFDTSVAVGCPPDQYSKKGQYWGFPSYKWDAHRADGFGWWKRRLHLAEQYFHTYRIDHVVGFFKLWLIPHGKKPIDGAYHPRDFDDWMALGTELMQMMIGATSMQPIGEDLGVVPTAVRRVLRHLGIATTMFFPWENELGEYLPGDAYPELSLTTVSTHDSLPLGLWWREIPRLSEKLTRMLDLRWKRELTPELRLDVLKYAHGTRSQLTVNLLQEYLALEPSLVHPKLEDERINVPGTHSRKNWSYRCIPSIEQLQQHDGLKTKIQEVLS
jgi:4-alpha-glucanotransferase